MRLMNLYKNKKYGVPIVSIVFLITCLIVSISTYFDNNLIYLFATYSKPSYFWQYFSGIFEHTIFNICTGEYAPWFIFVHLGINIAILMLFGLIIEKNLGSRRMLIITLVASITNVVAFMFINNVILKAEFALSVGASGVVYSYAPIAIYYILKNLKKDKNYNQVLLYIYIIVLLCMYVIITCLSSFIGSNIWHLIGTIVGAIFLFIYKKNIDEQSNEKYIEKYKKNKFWLLLFILPISMLIIVLLYKFNIINIY